ncbi:hypothetical protein [Nocardia thailandica]
MSDRGAAGFGVDDVTAGPFAHGYGTTDDGRTFAFRTRRAVLTLEIYRADLGERVPEPGDVVAIAQAGVNDIDLGDERSIAAFVYDLIPTATPVAGTGGREMTVLRGILGRISAVIDGM